MSSSGSLRTARCVERSVEDGPVGRHASTASLQIVTKAEGPAMWMQILKEDDNNWPQPDRVGRQELEIVMGPEHISFTTTKLGSLLQAIHRHLCCTFAGTFATFCNAWLPMTFHLCVRSIIVQVQQSQDPEGLRIFYYLVQVRQQPADTVPPHTGSML